MSEYKYRKTYTIGFDNGKPIRKDIKSNNKKDFVAKCKSMEQLIENGVSVSAQERTVESWAWTWYNIYKKPQLGIKQQKNLEAILRLHILPAIGHYPIGAVKSYHLQEFLNSQAGKSTSQLQKIRGAINQMFQRAELDRIISYTPARKLCLPKGKENPRRSLTNSERDALYSAIETHRGNIWIRFMLQCGLRRGETVPLQWCDIDFENGILTVNKAVEYNNETPVIKSTKTESGIRHIPIPPDFLDLLLKRKLARKEDWNHLIIYNRSGAMLKQTQIKRLWMSVQRKWDIAMGAKTTSHGRVVIHALDQSITPHYLRHTYCTDLRRRGVSLREAQALMGHSDIRTTANIYDHYDLDDAIETGRKIYDYQHKNDTNLQDIG